MPALELMTGSGLGSLLGMRHALEPDHLAAVSTLVSRERSGVRAALLGVCWGLGHTFSLVQAARQGAEGPTRVHRHGRRVHSHAGLPAHVHIGMWTLARRPLLVGAVHGLAGSGALTALVLTTQPTTAARLAYMALFGLGSTVSMAALSGLLGWPLARFGTHHLVARGVSLIVGCTSTVLGVMWGQSAIARLL